MAKAKPTKNDPVQFNGSVCGVSTLKPLGKDDGVGNMFAKITLQVPVDEVDLNQMAQFQRRAVDLAISVQPVQGELPGVKLPGAGGDE